MIGASQGWILNQPCRTDPLRSFSYRPPKRITLHLTQEQADELEACASLAYDLMREASEALSDENSTTIASEPNNSPKQP